jgi:hypothetical protein
MKIDICEVIENEDGSADYKFLFDDEALISFAMLGMRFVIEKELEKYGHPNTERAGNSGSGEESDKSVPPEFPGF